jgi:hypothetical protein
MSLEKARIINLDTHEEIEVLFNPDEYVIEKTTKWQPHEVPGLDAPEVEFTLGDSMTLQMELFFDTFETAEDVRNYTSRIESLAMVDPELHRPPLCLFTWGKFSFQGVLEHLTQRFVMFTPEGIPVRALLSVRFREYRPAEQQMQEKPRSSPDRTKAYTVKRGDTLCFISWKHYNDPALWRIIADANGLEDPLLLKPGQVLVIPPLRLER